MPQLMNTTSQPTATQQGRRDSERSVYLSFQGLQDTSSELYYTLEYTLEFTGSKFHTKGYQEDRYCGQRNTQRHTRILT